MSGREQPEDVVLAEELKKEINRFLHGLSTREQRHVCSTIFLPGVN